ncbi:hypothetical protein B0H11DRAFT_2132578 [Mycena galericulata]|nr:hypothetical protein B0H11DRAFT_2132578 [Mycena galericulata]
MARRPQAQRQLVSTALELLPLPTLVTLLPRNYASLRSSTQGQRRGPTHVVCDDAGYERIPAHCYIGRRNMRRC